ncbi:nuclear transcription factor Y subunit B-8-like isoform X1 [Solanum tuberosum]|uniref:nuclear transcription factor Y subunit B-8-like isoform X1 n=2 Tax=Solanum tuberosum TaxID=4113 RepID=UPI00073A4383|nr:PREDICTED: nuclear transcription factor Y subunit B-8-like isoform X1 [Solanum tuberosum]XP_015168333.1 PREDICTED: nuclear transcription factor Y subunit B-8-like isoform X1 [Solanum tuberosum]
MRLIQTVRLRKLKGSGNGGFHSYRRSPQPTPARSPSPDMERSMELPSHLNQEIAANEEDSECTIREQDRFMPIANVVRNMRKILPPQAKIADESKLVIQECVSEFISFVTGEANDRCKLEQRKTITAEDLLWAMNALGFDDYVEPLTLYLQRYRELDGGERGSVRGDPLPLKRPMVNPASGYSLMPNHLPPNFPMAHHHGYFVYPPPMGNSYRQGDASSGSSSHECAVAAVDSDIESPAEKSKE